MLSFFEQNSTKVVTNSDADAPEGTGEGIEYTNTGNPQPGEHQSGLNAPLKIEVIDTEDRFDAIKEEWDHLAERTGARIFQTFEWSRLWWKYFGRQGELNILAFRHKGKLVGVAPLYLETKSLLGIYSHRHLKFIGSCVPEGGTRGAFSNYSPSDYLDFIVDDAFSDKVAESLVAYLKHNDQYIDQISFKELPEDGFMMKKVVPDLKNGNGIVVTEKSEVCPNTALPDSMKQYLSDRKRSTRYNLRSARRAVTEKQLFRIADVQSLDEFDRAFDKLVKLHQERWNSMGYPGAFADARFERFIREVSKEFLKRNRVRMKVALDDNDNYVALNLAYSYNSRVYDSHKAFDISSELAQHSPGTALIYFLIEDAIEEGNEVFDMMRGGERYKMRLADSAPQNWNVKILKAQDGQEFKKYLYKLVSGFRSGKLRILRELLLLKIHIRVWGWRGFASTYVEFLKNRFEGKNQ
jgi:CelD/BcsL family acetyltransferase involved in cellulose biosynthesis